MRIPVREFYEMEVYVRGIVLVSDGPGDDDGGGQLGRVIDEGLDDWDFHALSPSPERVHVKIIYHHRTYV